MPLNGDIRTRPSAGGRPKPPSLAAVAKDAAGDLIDLVGAQVRLIRVEMAADLRVAAVRVAWAALFVAVLLVGYAFAMAAVATGLAVLWGWSLSLVAVAALQVAIGGAGLWLSLARLRGVRVLNRSSAEATQTLQRAIEATSASNPGRL